jgi:hypothetical protein
MLTKKWGSRRLRWGVVALTALVPFTLPVAASAAQGPTATGESIQYVNVTVNPPAGTQTSTYDNSVYAASATSWHSPFKFTYKLRNSSAPIIAADNYAQADVSSCSHCSATAIAFQVVLVSKQTLARLTAIDAALGTTNGCRTCNSLAEAFQIVYATDDASQLSLGVTYASNETASKLRALQNSGLSTAQIQSRSTTLVQNLIGFLQAASHGPGPLGSSNTYGSEMGWTPAINGADQHTALTSNTQPIIDLMSEIQH